MRNKVLIILLLIAGLAGAFVWRHSQRLTTSQTAGAVERVVLMKAGMFEPSELAIDKGTKVVFINEDNRPRWPASNLHPTHGIYPEFDPREPVPAGGEWTFVFDKAGAWKFHDHLFPGVRGTITVLDK